MPTLFIIFGLRFYLFANDHEPIHVHVQKGEGTAKFNVYPQIELLSSNKMKPKELLIAEGIVIEKRQEIIDAWNKFFKKEVK